MKYYIFVMMLMVASFSFSQSDTLLQDLNTVEVVDYTFDKVSSIVGSLASELKVPAEHVYEVLVKQQIVISITYLSLFIIGVVPLVLIIKGLYSKDLDKISEGEVIVGIIVITLLLVIISIPLFNINSMITGFINPEYGAIEHILNLLK